MNCMGRKQVWGHTYAYTEPCTNPAKFKVYMKGRRRKCFCGVHVREHRRWTDPSIKIIKIDALKANEGGR
jgi:hypothetical protein